MAGSSSTMAMRRMVQPTIPQRSRRDSRGDPLCQRFAIFHPRPCAFHPRRRRNARAKCTAWRARRRRGPAMGEWAKPPASDSNQGQVMSNSERLDGAAILRREWRELGKIILEGLVAGIVVSIVLALAVFIVTSPALAAAPQSGALYL